MNEQFNPFRTVPRQEVERDHTFRSLRHFPEISKSISHTGACIETRTAEASALAKSTSGKKKKKKTTSLKSTHYLDALCKSSLNEFSTLSQFRKQIINDREKPAAQSANIFRRTQSKGVDPLESGNAKLTKFAIRHDSRRENNDLEGFNGYSLNKEEFDYQLKHCLTIYLTRDELDAVFTHIDTDKSDFIDGVEFLRYFFKLGQDARDDIRAELMATAMKTQAMKDKKKEDERIRISDENYKFKIEFTKENFNSGIGKLCKFVSRFNPTLDCVEFRDITSLITPLEFKIVLEKLTNVRFTDPEIAALLDKYADPVPPRLVKNGVWCTVDGSLLIKSFIELRRLEVIKDKERDLANSQVYEKVQQKLGGGVDVFPKCLGR